MSSNVLVKLPVRLFLNGKGSPSLRLDQMDESEIKWVLGALSKYLEPASLSQRAEMLLQLDIRGTKNRPFNQEHKFASEKHIWISYGDFKFFIDVSLSKVVKQPEEVERVPEFLEEFRTLARMIDRGSEA